MFAVGIDVSKGKSTVAVKKLTGEVVYKPFDVSHTAKGLKCLIVLIKSLPGESKAVMEATGNYHEPIAKALRDSGLFVSVVNAYQINRFDVGKLRRAKTDKKDALKIADYVIHYWSSLYENEFVNETRRDLKLLNRQYHINIKLQSMLRTNLVSQLDLVFPDINKQFTSPERESDGHEKWIDFFARFPHRDLVANIPLSVFKAKYQRFCKKNKYLYSDDKAKELHDFARDQIAALSYSDNIRQLFENMIAELNTLMETNNTIRRQMDELARMLPEYDTVASLYGVGRTTAPQLMAEIGDPLRFHSVRAITAFAGYDTVPYESGQKKNENGRHITKNGSPYLRRTLFLVMTTYLEMKPLDEPVYQFLDKKRSEGKMYYVYMTAAANKFLRIYYARVRDALTEQ